MKEIKICIIGSNISSVFEGNIVGGMEKQCALIAEEFAARGYEVFILETIKGTNITLPKGITIIKTWEPSYGISGLRGIYRLFKLLAKINKIRPDVVYCRGTSLYSSLVTFYCALTKTRFLWGLASQKDIVPKIKYDDIINPTLYEFFNHRVLHTMSTKTMLKYSDLVICQTKEQYQAVNGRSRNSLLASNIIKSPSSNDIGTNVDKKLLWVGRLIGIKGEKELLLLAKKLYKYEFFVIGSVSERFEKTQLYQDLVNQENLKLTGKVSAGEINHYYKKSTLVIHTGPSEGFSNVFLEAWSYKLPVLSLYVNPNGLLDNNYLGFCCDGDIDLMAAKIERYIDDVEFAWKIGERARNYVVKNHSPKSIIDLIENRLRSLSK